MIIGSVVSKGSLRHATLLISLKGHLILSSEYLSCLQMVLLLIPFLSQRGWFLQGPIDFPTRVPFVASQDEVPHSDVAPE